MGTGSSRGTKAFALAGKIRRSGLVEVPMGTTLRQIVDDIGGGVREGHTLTDIGQASGITRQRVSQLAGRGQR